MCALPTALADVAVLFHLMVASACETNRGKGQPCVESGCSHLLDEPCLVVSNDESVLLSQKQSLVFPFRLRRNSGSSTKRKKPTMSPFSMCCMRTKHNPAKQSASIETQLLKHLAVNRSISSHSWPQAKELNKKVGVVSTARITHATPSNVYGHSVDRTYEFEVPEGCIEQVDIAQQVRHHIYEVYSAGGTTPRYEMVTTQDQRLALPMFASGTCFFACHTIIRDENSRLV